MRVNRERGRHYRDDVRELQKGIGEIGDRMVRCTSICSGILREPAKGIIPRCLVLETEKRSKRNGVTVVGINPGPIRDKENEWYRNNRQTYPNLLECWRKQIANLRYYRALRHMVDNIGFNGPILWTELAKCQSKKKGEPPPLQTFRNCTRRFLSQELKLVPTKWPLIAVGREAFKGLAYMYPERKVIGIPHPTGSRGNFKDLLDRLKRGFSKKRSLKIGRKEAVWLSDVY